MTKYTVSKGDFSTVTTSAIEAENLRARGYTVEQDDDAPAATGGKAAAKPAPAFQPAPKSNKTDK